MALIKGVHHVCMKCVTAEQFDEVRKFYGEILGLPVVRSWAAWIR